MSRITLIVRNITREHRTTRGDLIPTTSFSARYVLMSSNDAKVKVVPIARPRYLVAVYRFRGQLVVVFSNLDLDLVQV